MVRRFLSRIMVPVVLSWAAVAQVNVLTQSSVRQRHAPNFAETTLTAANVNVTEFGKLYSYRVDGAVDREPLYVRDVWINGARYNVLYVTTANDQVYAFDADGSSTRPFWIGKSADPRSGISAPNSTVFWDSPTDGPLGYAWSENDVLKAYRLAGGRLMMPAILHGAVLSPRGTGASLTLSANGSIHGTGIVWASMPATEATIPGQPAGILRAFDAETLNEIWTSEQNPTRDRTGTLPGFVRPVVANGRVYVPTTDGSVVVYGLLPDIAPQLNARAAAVDNGLQPAAGSVFTVAATADFTITTTPSSRTVIPGASTSYTIAITALNGFNGTTGLTVTGAPAATSTVFTPASVTGTGNATLKIATSSFTPSGTARLTIKGTSGLISHTATVTLVVGPPSAISVNFLGSSTAMMAAAEIAGVVPKTRWNNAAGPRRSTPLALVDDSGALRTASVIWTANNGWMTPILDQPGNSRMMKGYLDNTNTTVTTASVAGLPSGTYDVYVYTDGDNKAYTRTAAYQISGSGITTTTINVTDAPNTNFSGTFIQATGTNGNYVKFRIFGTGFMLKATPGTSTNVNVRAPINAVQIVNTSLTPPVSLSAPLTVSGIGAGQGVEMRDGKVYLYGDASTGVVREYDLVNNSALTFTGRQILLTAGGRDLVPHPTGLTVAPGIGTLLGNTVNEQGTILIIDWVQALAKGTLDGAVQGTVVDDLAVNGTRPEFVRIGGRWLVATADYGAVGNEIRIYDPERLKTAARTSEPGVLVYRFRSSPYVQTLHWLDSQGLLVLVQNQRAGQGWRLTVIDLARSIAAGQQVVVQTINLSPQDELEGFHLLTSGRGLFLTSSSRSNLYFANVRLF